MFAKNTKNVLYYKLFINSVTAVDIQLENPRGYSVVIVSGKYKSAHFCSLCRVICFYSFEWRRIGCIQLD